MKRSRDANGRRAKRNAAPRDHAGQAVMGLAEIGSHAMWIGFADMAKCGVLPRATLPCTWPIFTVLAVSPTPPASAFPHLVKLAL
jgi:hypothetical protein